MVEDKHGFATIRIPAKTGAQENPFVAAQKQLKDMHTRFNDWLAKPSLAMEAAVHAASGAVYGAALGGITGSILAGNPLIPARNFAIFTGFSAGLSRVLWRGTDDLQCSVFSGFYSGIREAKQACAEDEYYIKTRSMLNNLGLQKYEKNFKKGSLTDTTLPLLTESALKEVKIPPGPRLLILDHIERELKTSPFEIMLMK